MERQATQPVVRTNEDWVADLRANGARQGDALQALRSQLHRGLFAYLREQRSDMAKRDAGDVSQLAEDFTQEAVLKILENLATYRGESRFTTWAMKIGVRTAISNLRRAAYRDLSLDDLEERGASLRLSPDAAVRPARSPDPEREAELREVLEALEEAVRTKLTERQRIAFLATNVDGVPIEVAARLLNSNANALYKTVHDARRKIREFLVERGFTFDRVAPLFEGS